MIALAPYLATAERINHAENRHPYVAGAYDCQAFARAKIAALLAAGAPPEAVYLALVRDETGADHAVAELVGEIDGRPAVKVYDSRFSWSVEKSELERYGYVWRVEVPATLVLMLQGKAP